MKDRDFSVGKKLYMSRKNRASFFCALFMAVIIFISSFSAEGYELERYVEKGPGGVFLSRVLPSSTVSALAYDDATGFLWAGTTKGLVRFDGRDWWPVPLETGKESGEISVNDIAIMDCGVAVACDTGLYLYNVEKDTLERYGPENSPLRTEIVQALVFDYPLLYTGTWGGGLRIFDVKTKVWSGIPGSVEVDGKLITSMAYENSHSRLWVGTLDAGIYIYDSERWRRISTANSNLPSDRVHAIALSSAGVFIGTAEGLVLYDGLSMQIFTPENTEHRLAAKTVLSIDARKYEVWVGTSEGISRFYNGNWIRFFIESGAAKLRVISIASTTDEVWIGTNQRGLYRLRK